MTTTPPSPRLPPRLLLLLLLLVLLSLEQLRMVGAWVAPPPRPPAATTLQQRRHRQQQRARGRGHLLQASASEEEEEEKGGRHTRADAVRLGFLGGAAAAVWSSMGLAAAAPVIAAVPGKGKEGQNQQMAGPTFREKGRPALVEALVYLPKGPCCALPCRAMRINGLMVVVVAMNEAFGHRPLVVLTGVGTHGDIHSLT